MIQESDLTQVDAVVHSINPQGFFAHAGPLQLFVSAHVGFYRLSEYDPSNA